MGMVKKIITGLMASVISMSAVLVSTYAAEPNTLNEKSAILLEEYNLTADYGDEVVLSQTVTWISDEEFIIETLTESSVATPLAENSGERSNTVKREHGYKTTDGFYVTGTASLTCKFKYNEDKNTVS
ncbi:MAG: hypothetical protein K2O14_06435, partial [Oscillospiraceae bacterium]|nr:hypothetical protein [Oscillospiraceae bacterium]